LGETGRIAVGQAADLVGWSASMEVAATIIGGEVAFRRE
jgi:N-acetylglucosamine-6-phosphate deacetylase